VSENARVVLVTGAGSGMGRAMVEAFAARGDLIVAVDINGAAAEATIASLGRPKREAAAFLADVADGASVDSLGRDVLAAFGRVDVLCNNAGILDGYLPVDETDEMLWDRILDVNLKGCFLVSRRFLPGMLERGKGVILNTASVSSHVAGGGGAAYTASKHGVLGLTKQMAFDYGRRGVRVNAMCPGPILTGLTSHLVTPEGRNEHVDAVIAATPAGRWGRPEEVARLAVFLASDDADFVHGAGYVIDGGWTVP
jgi:3-oxoacyl-[acyl-carrier protein] reductase